MYLVLYVFFLFLVRLTITNDHLTALNEQKRSLTIITKSFRLTTANRLGIAISLNQSRQLNQHQQLTAILDGKNSSINQAVDRLGITIALFYLLLFGTLAKWETMNNIKLIKYFINNQL